MRSLGTILLVAALMLAPAMVAHASDWSGSPSFTGYQPSVPISALARPIAALDPSRFHVSTSVSVGSGFGGGTSGLQVTSFSYQFRAPMWMSVNLGNAWGAGTTSGGMTPFLEGLDVGFRPTQNMLFRVQYRDFRSPLQYSNFNNYSDPFFLPR